MRATPHPGGFCLNNANDRPVDFKGDHSKDNAGLAYDTDLAPKGTVIPKKRKGRAGHVNLKVGAAGGVEEGNQLIDVQEEDE